MRAGALLSWGEKKLQRPGCQAWSERSENDVASPIANDRDSTNWLCFLGRKHLQLGGEALAPHRKLIPVIAKLTITGTHPIAGTDLLFCDLELIELFAVGGQLADRQGPAIDIGDGQGMNVGNELVGEFLPRIRVTVLLDVVEIFATGTRYQVDDALR